MKSIFFTLLCLSIAYVSNAATYTTTSTPGTWDLGSEPGTTPLASDDIIVNHDWSGYDWAATSARANYAGTMTINSGGYIKLNNSATNWTGAIDVKSGGSLVVNGAYSFDGGTINVDGYFEVTSNNLAITNGALTITGTGEISYGSKSGPGTIAGTITLPVELIEFKVESTNFGNLIEWTTLSEINNDYFEVQKSLDGKEFTTISTVTGSGNSIEINNYSYADNNKEIQVYYRLKQVDFNGDYSFSHIVSSGSKPKYQIISLNQNNEFYVTGDLAGQITLTVVDLLGSTILQKEIQLEKGGIANFVIPKNGLFIVNVSSSLGLLSEKVIVK